MRRFLGLLALLLFLVAGLAAWKASLGWNAHAIAYVAAAVVVLVVVDAPYWNRPQ